MDFFQNILAYLILFLAVAYLAWKFIIPKSLLPANRKNSKSCGQDDCGCH